MTRIRAKVQPSRSAQHTARVVWITAAVAAALTAGAARAQGQRGGAKEPESLHGSKASVEKMYDFALQHRYPFYLTPTNVDAAIAAGRLVPLTGDSTYELTRGVGFSYATREAKQFVTAFAPQYLYACGTPLTVTSAARPMSRQPHNANPHSVHPTGIAVDIRRPPPGPCLNWVRGALAQLESRGIVEATEEHHPVHLHVAVLAAPGSRVVLPNLTQGMVAAARVPVAPATVEASATANVSAGEVSIVPNLNRTYVVRQGDTLYDIAMKMGVSVQALAEANDRKEKMVLKPGTVLKVPERGTK
ncbi:MAG: Peptidase [Gemmatimonadetes bacterium]|jgi:LysM repeat protein|nr:Peptidase [Gemmatimonadota bacterium]